MNVSEDDFVLRRGEVIGEAEQVTAANNKETALRPSGREEVFSEAAATTTMGLVEEPDVEERCDDKHIQVVIANLPPELDLDQRTTAEKFIRDRAGLLSKSYYDIGRTNLVQRVIDTGLH